MHVALGSIFQNSTSYIDRYAAQYYSLVAYAPEHTFEPLLVEGDSTDAGATWDKLNVIFPGHVTKREHGGPRYPSVDNPQRWRQVSYACDGVLERVRPDHHVLFWVEADLLWEPAMVLRMLEHIRKPEVHMVCPMIMLGGAFYDTWGFTAEGLPFRGAPPYHRMFVRPGSNGLHQLDHGGSCWLVRGDLARACRFRPPETAIRGFCGEIRQRGGKIWIDPKLKVNHPRV